MLSEIEIFKSFVSDHLKIFILRILELSKPKTCHRNFLSAAYFSVHPVEKCCQLFLDLLQEKISLCSLLNGSN